MKIDAYSVFYLVRCVILEDQSSRYLRSREIIEYHAEIQYYGHLRLGVTRSSKGFLRDSSKAVHYVHGYEGD